MKNLIYLDEDAVNEELITYHGVELEEIIQRISRTTNIGGEVGGEAGDPTGLFAKLKAAISTNYERGKEKEFVYDLSEGITKFVLLLEVLDESGAINISEDFNVENRNNLATDSPIMITAPMICTPIGEIKNKFDINKELNLLDEGFADLARSGILGAEETSKIEDLQNEIESLNLAASGMKKMFTSLSDDDDIYRTKTASEVDFVMGLPEQNFRDYPKDFPSATREYVILGKVMTNIEEDTEIPLINFTELAERKTDDPRKQRTEERKMKARIASLADNMLERDVDTSEFELSYPDVQIHLWLSTRSCFSVL